MENQLFVLGKLMTYFITSPVANVSVEKSNHRLFVSAAPVLPIY